MFYNLLGNCALLVTVQNKKKGHHLRTTEPTRPPYIALRVQRVIEHFSTWKNLFFF